MYPLWAMTMGGAVVAAPTLTSVSTSGGAVGDIAGTYPATLTGANFTGATGVTFGGTAATSVVVVNATTITCVVPAHATGGVSVVVTTPGGSNGANTAFTYYSPAQRSLSWWTRGSFVSNPQATIASAGTSGGKSLINGVSPTVGTAVNGIAPAKFNGTTQYDDTASVLGDLVTGSGGSIMFMYLAPTAPAAAGAGYQDPCLLSMNLRGDFALSVTAAGVRAYGLDASSNVIDTTKAASLAAWHTGIVRWGPTTLEVGVDGAFQTTQTLAGGGMLSTNYAATNFRVACDYIASVFGNLSVMEIIAEKTLWTNTDVTNLRAYLNTRYFPAGATV